MFLEIALATLVPFLSHLNFRIVLFIAMKNLAGILIGIALPGYLFGKNKHLYHVESSPRIQYVYLFRFSSFFSGGRFFSGRPRHMEFPGQGSDPNHGCHLWYSCSNPGSSTHCARPGIEPASWCCRDAANSVVPQQELLRFPFISLINTA